MKASVSQYEIMKDHRFPDPRFLEAVNCFRGDKNAIKMSIKTILDFNFRNERIQGINPSELAVKFASHVGIFFGDGPKYASELSATLRELVKAVWDEIPRSGYRSEVVRRTQLGVTISIQIQTRIALKSCPINRHREDLVCYIALSNTHDSEGEPVRRPLTVYCCGNITALRLWGLCGMYYGADMEPDNKTSKARFLKKIKEGCGEENEYLLA